MNTTVLGDFLKAILRVYKMESFVCYWLNELLRSEDWEEINVLTPFLVCLVYTFKRSGSIIKCQEPLGFTNSLRGFVGQKKLLSLYRGASLTREHLNLYNPDKIKYFCGMESLRLPEIKMLLSILSGPLWEKPKG